MSHPKMVTPRLIIYITVAIIEPLTLTRHHGRYSTVTPPRALASVGGWPLHMAFINLKQLRFRRGYGMAVKKVQPPVSESEVKPPPQPPVSESEVKPPPQSSENTSKQLRVWVEFFFKGNAMGVGLVSQNPGPNFFDAIKAGAWPAPGVTVTGIKTATWRSKSPGAGRGKPAGWGAPSSPLGGD